MDMNIGDKVQISEQGLGCIKIESINDKIATCVWIDSDGQPHREEYSLSVLEECDDSEVAVGFFDN